MLNQKQIDAINQVNEAVEKLLFFGEEAENTLMGTYYRIIQFHEEDEIVSEVNAFFNFVIQHNAIYLKSKLKTNEA